MDCNLKANSWDLTEFKQEAIPILDSFDSRSATSFADNKTTRGDFSIDLKLGRVGHSNDEAINQWKPAGVVSKMECSSPSVSTKRARPATNGTQIAYCLVDGCNADLSNCRDYHRRHKVCELHSKSPQVTIAGQKQRFCQQCSRFHSLEEFDEGKRSCRKRLDGHNRRRRKPQPDLLSRHSSLLSNYKGTQVLPFSTSHVYPSATVMSSAWSGVINSASDAAAAQYSAQQQMNMTSKHNVCFGSSLSSSSSSSYRGGKQFPFFQLDSSHPILNNHQTASAPLNPVASVCQPLLGSTALSESSGCGSYSMFCGKLGTIQVHDSDCALSLLSSTQTQTSGNHMLQPNSVPLVQTIETVDSVLVSNGSNGLSPWSAANRAPQTLPFNWQ